MIHYPAAPLFVPHELTEDCIISGYTIPKGTRLLVNVLKIQHDPHIWTDPFEFQPERFLTSEKEIDVKGQHFELIPFGGGRRMCPGISFALEALSLILANIIHGFELHNLSNNKIDMTESPRLTNLKATPLELLVALRLSSHFIFVVTVVSILLFGHLARIRNGANRSNMVPEAAGSEQNGDEFKKAIIKFNELLGVLVPSDVIPGLRWLDLGGYENMMKKTSKKMDVIIDGCLEEHKKKMDYPQTIDESKHQVFMTTLLSRVNEEFIKDCYGFSTDTVVKATCVDRHETALVNASFRQHLEMKSDTSLKYSWLGCEGYSSATALLVVKAISSKVMRPPKRLRVQHGTKSIWNSLVESKGRPGKSSTPLSLPHESIEDCTVGGYTVPKGTRLLVNIWKIQHDPHRWTNPFEFQPERFLTSNKEIDVNGQHFQLIPFSSGRRMCPGKHFAIEALLLILASIIHVFEFKNPSSDKIDMTESHGLANLKPTPLELLVAPRILPH
ncbi:cytochrome P450 CYP82D47-like protein [Tanacetum coccineum]